MCFYFITFFREERYDFSKTMMLNAVSCDVKCSYLCNLCIFCVCFFSEIQVWDPRSACAGSQSAYACVEERVKPRRARDHAHLWVLRDYIRPAFLCF